MASELNYLDIVLLGKEYRVSCPPQEQAALRAAVEHVSAKMHEIAERTKSNISERIAVMAALNIAHELLSQQAASSAQLTVESQTGLDIAQTKRRIRDMETQLDAALASQEKLF